MSISASSLDALRMIEREPVRDASAAVVADDGEALVAERAHQRDHVGRHRALAVLRVIELGRRRRRRLGRVAIAAQVGNDEREVGGERARDAVPHRVRLRVAVQQQQRRLRRSPPVRANSSTSPAGRSPASNPSNQAIGTPPRRDARFVRRFGSRAARRYTGREAPICSGLRALYKFG